MSEEDVTGGSCLWVAVGLGWLSRLSVSVVFGESESLQLVDGGALMLIIPVRHAFLVTDDFFDLPICLGYAPYGVGLCLATGPCRC